MSLIRCVMKGLRTIGCFVVQGFPWLAEQCMALSMQAI